jgi:hypothetical protein
MRSSVVVAILLSLLVCSAWAEEPDTSDSISVSDEHKVLCTFAPNGKYERGVAYQDVDCKDYWIAVLQLLPYAWFCWWSDPCSERERCKCP